MQKTLLVVAFTFAGFLATNGMVSADANQDLKAICRDNPKSALCQGYVDGENDSQSRNPVTEAIKNIIQILYFVVGVLATFFVIYGGFKYVNSQGDSQKTANGRNMIVYSLVGVIVALLAGQLVIFVIDKL